MAQTLTQLLNANIETLRQEAMPYLYELSTFFSGKILKGTKAYQITKTTNSLDFRAPLMINPPGKYGAVSLAGGNLGLGSGFDVKHLVQTYFATKLGFQLNYDARMGTKTKGQSVVNAFKETTKAAFPVFQRYDDVSWHSIGGSQGIIGQATAYASNVYTMDSEYGADLIVVGQSAEIFDTTLVTQKTSNSTPDSLPTVTAVDKINKTVTFTSLSGLATAAAATDKLLFEGCGATPAWANGLQYFNDNSTSGNLLGLSRSSYPEIVANGVNAAGALTVAQGLLLKHRIFKRRGKLPTGLRGSVNVAQQATMLLNANQISEWMRGRNDKTIDQLPQVEDEIVWCGITHDLDGHQSNKRVDWVNKDVWGRVYLDKEGADFFENMEGKKFFEQRGSNGGVLACDLFYWLSTQNYYCVDPGSQGYIYNLTVGSGY